MRFINPRVRPTVGTLGNHLARRTLGAGSIAALAVWTYRKAIRPRILRWGATDEELARPLPGDSDVPHPVLAATRAVTIDAPPEAVWPWIVQIGYHRAGWYANDLFDNDDIPSAESILPEFQHLEIGQVLGEEGNAVREVEPNRHLLLGFSHPNTEWVIKQGMWPKFGNETMCFYLDPIMDGRRTRLILRTRVDAPLWARPLLAGFFEPADFVQSRKLLTGVKRRAETHAARVA